MFENVDIHTHTYGRQRPTYAISSPVSLKVQVSLKYIDVHVSILLEIFAGPKISNEGKANLRNSANC